jgi:hypothetical protein
MTPIDDDTPPADPAESLALIARERASLERSLRPDPRLMFWPWGFAWLVGFGLFFLRHGPGGRVFVGLPDWLPLATLMVLLISAGVFTGMIGAHAARQTAGPSARRASMYGWTWTIGFAGLSLLFSQFSGILPEDRLGLLWAGGTVGLTGTLHAAGGAIWNDRGLFLLGVWTCVVNAVAVLAGPGWHSLIVAVAGGGGMLVAGLAGWLRRR